MVKFLVKILKKIFKHKYINPFETYETYVWVDDD